MTSRMLTPTPPVATRKRVAWARQEPATDIWPNAADSFRRVAKLIVTAV